MKKINKKTITLVLVLTFSLSPFFAIPAKAQWVVSDPVTEVNTGITAASTITSAAANTTAIIKDTGLDSIAWMVANLIIQRIAASTVNWINSGFQGSPAFVTDPAAYFQDIGDKIAGQFIFINPSLKFLCGPISAKIRLALAKNYINDLQWQCTLTQVGRNMTDFMNNFSNGGWDSFFEMTQKQQNNPIGAYLQAQNELNAQISTRQGTAQKELNWGQGFMSWKKCEEYGTMPPGQMGPPPCTKEVTNTPGSVIQTQLNKVLGSGGDKLAVADEINEIVAALLNQLVSRVVGGIGNGLRGSSNPSPTESNQSFADLMSKSSAGGTTDYFGNSQDTSILNKPVPSPVPAEPIINPVSSQCNPADPSYDPSDPQCGGGHQPPVTP